MKKKSTKSISKGKSLDKSKSKSKEKDKKDKSDDKSVKSSKSNKSLKAKLTKKNTTTSKNDSSIIPNDLSPHSSKLEPIPQEITQKEQLNSPLSYPQRDYNGSNSQGTGNSNQDKRCDGCFESQAVIYCKDCSKQYCKVCEDQIHIIPVHRNHFRVPLYELIRVNKLCYHHNKALTLFCDTCNETICDECQIIGPHNNKLHRICDIQGSFRKKYHQLTMENKQILISKLHQYEKAQVNIESIFEKLRVSKKNIERDLRTQYTALIEKVKGIEGKKTALLSYESSQLQNQLNIIEDILNAIRDISGTDSPDMISFLLRYNQFNDSIDKIIFKPFKEPIITSSSNDFPNDLAERHKKLEEFDLIKKKLEKKDEVIWGLLIEHKEKQLKELNDYREKSKNDIAEWVKLSDRYALEIKKYNVVCSFCGKFLDESTINSKCTANEQFTLSKFFTKKSPPTPAINSLRHFFSEPMDNLDQLVIEAEIELKRQRDEKEAIRIKQEQEKEAKRIKEEQEKEAKRLREEQAKEARRKREEEEDEEDRQREEQEKEEKRIRERERKLRDKRINIRRSFSFSGNKRLLEDFIKTNSQIEAWVIKIATHITENNINFLQLLKDNDFDHDGYIKPNDLKVMFIKLDSNLKEVDFDNMLSYFSLSDIQKIKIVDFARNFKDNILSRSQLVTESDQ